MEISIGTKERKERELLQRKQLILEKSKELFFSKGFNQVSIKDICDAIEYGRSAIYKLFDSKEEIYGYIYVEGIKILADILTEIEIDDSDPITVIKDFTEGIFTFFSEYYNYYKAIFYFDSNHVAFSKIPEELITKKLKERERGVLPIREILVRGIDSGLLKSFDADNLINTYFYSISGILNHYIAYEDQISLETVHESIISHAEIFGAGLKL